MSGLYKKTIGEQINNNNNNNKTFTVKNWLSIVRYINTLTACLAAEKRSYSLQDPVSLATAYPAAVKYSFEVGRKNYVFHSVTAWRDAGGFIIKPVCLITKDKSGGKKQRFNDLFYSFYHFSDCLLSVHLLKVIRAVGGRRWSVRVVVKWSLFSTGVCGLPRLSLALTLSLKFYERCPCRMDYYKISNHPSISQ